MKVPVNPSPSSIVYCVMHSAIATDMIRVERRERTISELDDIDALVRTHRARLLRFVTFSVGDEDLAASIVQDCFLRAYTKRDQFRGDSSVSTWLTTIALNLVRDHQRARKFQFWRKAAKTSVDVTEMASVLPAHETSPEARMMAEQKAAAVFSVVATLSENQRIVFLLRFSEEMELAAIADAMDMKLSTVKTHLHRAVRAVREKVGQAR